jgi:hypothetical protein
LDNYDSYSIIAEIVREETKFLRHYVAKVENNIDPLGGGRVLVTIPEIGFLTPDQGVWASPRQGHGISVPTVGQYVEVYFMAGDSGAPVYLHLASEMMGMLPAAYMKIPTSRVVFQSPSTGDCIKYDDILKQLDIIATLFIKLNNGTEPFVLGTQLYTYLSAVNTFLIGLGFGGYPVVPLGVLSTKIFGA